MLGLASFEEEGSSNLVCTGSEEEIASITAGKEFGLIRTTTGKVGGYLISWQLFTHLIS